MRIKEGASIQGLDIRMRLALITADELWEKYGKELVITSGLDGTHSAGSLHYYGLAVDLRTHYFDSQTLQIIRDQLDVKLGGKFDVILHKTHIHVEYDPKDKKEKL